MLDPLPFLKSVTIDWENIPASDRKNYPYSIPSISRIDRLDFHKNVTFIVGENGSGKSTLIEAIARSMGMSSEGGNRNFNLDTSQSISRLYSNMKAIKSFGKPVDYYYLRAESFYNVATYMDEVRYTGEYGGISLHAQSHGESFMAVLNKKLKGGGLYIFDEPEAALSPSRQLSALSSIHSLVEQGSQFIIATHSPIFLAYPHALLLEISNEGLKEIEYEETEHFKVYDLFFKNRKGMIERVLHRGDK